MSDSSQSDAQAPEMAPPSPNDRQRLEAIVAEWFSAHIANSPVTRQVEALNHLTAQLPALVEALTKG